MAAIAATETNGIQCAAGQVERADRRARGHVERLARQAARPTSAYTRQNRAARDQCQRVETAGDRQRPGETRVGDERPQRHAVLRAHGPEDARQVAVASERELQRVRCQAGCPSGTRSIEMHAVTRSSVRPGATHTRPRCRPAARRSSRGPARAGLVRNPGARDESSTTNADRGRGRARHVARAGLLISPTAPVPSPCPNRRT